MDSPGKSSGKGGKRMASPESPPPQKQYGTDELIKKAANLTLVDPPPATVETLTSYFPSCPLTIVHRVWINAQSNLDVAINLLLDEGYEMSADKPKEAPKVEEEGASSASASASVVDDPDAPNDGEDWIDMPLTDSFISTITSTYGAIDFGNGGLTDAQKKIRIPPALAFDLFRLIHENGLKRQRDEVERAAKD